MQITQRKSPNRNTGRQGREPDMIVLHTTEGAFDGVVSWITDPLSQVSYHFVAARDGRVAQAVDIQDTAWANGTTSDAKNRGNKHSRVAAVRQRNANANLYTISIGCEGRFSETGGALSKAQLDATVMLINHIRTEVKRIYGAVIPIDRQHIVGHSCITPRWKPNCPGADFPFKDIISRLEQGTDMPSEWAYGAWTWATEKGLTDGKNPQGIPTREQMIMLLHNYHQAETAPLGQVFSTWPT